jgi:fumarylacetoacetase
MNYSISPDLKSWISVPENSDFPIQNLPFGVVRLEDQTIACCSRIGDTAIDLAALQQLGYFADIDLPDGVFLEDTLNYFIGLDKSTHRQVRTRLAELFDSQNSDLQAQSAHHPQILHPLGSCEPLMPVAVGNYTDFYSSKEHATNVGKMFRDPENALLPNWLHIPVGYHGRASSIVVSGEPIHRPMGQTMPPNGETPVFGPSKRLDFELEMAFITRQGKPLGQRIGAHEAEDYIFGMVIFNDWSARDIQKWEYVPLGPFLAKNFASSISPWIVTLDALEPFRTACPEQNPAVLPYLKAPKNGTFDLALEVLLQQESHTEATTICRSNFKYLYWSMAQQLAHHTVNGCNMEAGDMLASGTISGPTEASFGSMLELSWSGQKPLALANGNTRTFIEDGDTIIMRARAQNNQLRIGFGEVSTKVLPAIPFD